MLHRELFTSSKIKNSHFSHGPFFCPRVPMPSRAAELLSNSHVNLAGSTYHVKTWFKQPLKPIKYHKSIDRAF